MSNLNVRMHGKVSPLKGDKHFTDFITSSQDQLAGDLMAEIIGDTYIDYREDSPVDQWAKIMKALRVHGFVIDFISRSNDES